MPILDDKAKLFGKINIVDLALIILGCFVIVFIVVFLQFYKYPKPIVYYITPNSATVGSGAKLQVVGSNFRKSSAAFIGDNRVSPPVNYINDRTVEVTLPPGLAPGKYDVKIANKKKMGALANALTIVPAPKPPPPPPARWIKLKVKFQDLMPEVAEQIKEGSTGKNAALQPVAKIVKIISVEPSKILRINKDVVALLEILQVGQSNAYSFRDQVVKINKTVKFEMDSFYAEGVIIDMEK